MKISDYLDFTEFLCPNDPLSCKPSGPDDFCKFSGTKKSHNIAKIVLTQQHLLTFLQTSCVI